MTSKKSPAFKRPGFFSFLQQKICLFSCNPRRNFRQRHPSFLQSAAGKTGAKTIAGNQPQTRKATTSGSWIFSDGGDCVAGLRTGRFLRGSPSRARELSCVPQPPPHPVVSLC